MKKNEEVVFSKDNNLKPLDFNSINTRPIPTVNRPPKNCKEVVKIQAMLLQVYKKYQIRHFNSKRQDLNNTFMDEEGKRWAICCGNVLDIMYNDDGTIKAICILNPSVLYDDNHYENLESDSHFWLFLDRMKYYKSDRKKDNWIKIAIGSNLNFMAHICKYKSGNTIRNGPKEWCPLSSNIQFFIKGRNILKNIPNILVSKAVILICQIDDKSKTINMRFLNEKEKLENDLKSIRNNEDYNSVIWKEERKEAINEK